MLMQPALRVALGAATSSTPPRMALAPSATAAGGTGDALDRLAGEEARARSELGRVAARFLAIRGHERLGFARIGDYSSERLGISGRELRSFAFVSSRLDALPLVAAAFFRGEISWSRTRLLCSAADRDSEAAWIARARGLTVSDLVGEIRRSRAAAVAGAGDAAAAGDALDDESDASDGEPRARFSILCPARVGLLWRRAIELARRMLGSQAPVSQAAEAIAAEAGSGVPSEVDEEVDREESCSPSVFCASLPVRPEVWAKPPLDSLDAFALDRVLRELTGALSRIDADLGRELRRAVDRRLHRALGFASFDAYAHERLGISPAKARALVALDRRTRGSREFSRAYRSGELSWVKALAIAPVAGGGFEAAWVARASEVMVRRLNDEVEWVLDMRDALGRPAAPPEAGMRLEKPDLQTCAGSADAAGEVADRRVTFYGPTSVVVLFRAGVRGATGVAEPPWKGLERLLLHVIAEWEAQPRHRDPIFLRDGWRCAVPGCTSRKGLEDHHILFRSRGGGNEQSNRITACAWHHHGAIHRHVVRASGRAPDDVVWELGLRPGRVPLLRVRGERYCSLFEN